MRIFKKILALGAHPDDIEFSCYGLLLKSANLGSSINTYILSMGSMGDKTSGISRIQESRNALSSISGLNFQFREKVGLDRADFSEIEGLLRNQIIDLRPDLVLVHDPNDSHQEHRLLYEATIAAARRIRCTIFKYRSVSTITGFNPSVFVDITEVFEQKVNSLKFHASQITRPYMQLEALEDFHKLWFSLSRDIKYAESYSLEQLILG